MSTKGVVNFREIRSVSKCPHNYRSSTVLTQPPPPGFPERFELREASMMSRLWSSFLPVMGRGVAGAEDAPVSLLLHSFTGQGVVIALCADLHLRFWSEQVRDWMQARACWVSGYCRIRDSMTIIVGGPL